MALHEVWVLVFDWSLIFALVILLVEKRGKPCVHESKRVALIWPSRLLVAVSLLVICWAAPRVDWLRSFAGWVSGDLADLYCVQVGIDAVGALVFHWKGRHNFERLFAVNFPFLVPYVVLPVQAAWSVFLYWSGLGVRSRLRAESPDGLEGSCISTSSSKVDGSGVKCVEEPAVQSVLPPANMSETTSGRLGDVGGGCAAGCVRQLEDSFGREPPIPEYAVRDIMSEMKPWMRKVLLELNVRRVMRRKELRLTRGQARDLDVMGLIVRRKKKDTVEITGVGDYVVRLMDRQFREILSQAGRGGGGWARGSPHPFQKGPRSTGSGAASPNAG